MNKRRRHQLERIVYIVSFLAVLTLVIGGIVFGFSLLKKETDQNNTTTRGQEPVSGEEYTVLPNENADDFSVATQTEEIEEPEVAEEVDATDKADEEEIEVSDPAIELKKEAEQIVFNMTLEEKVYQLFIVTPDALTGVNGVTMAGDTTRQELEKYPVGGLVYFAENLIDTDQTRTMLEKTQEYADEIEGLPLFLCVDEEGGKVARIANNSAFGVENVGNMRDISTTDQAYEAGRKMGAYLADLGFNFNFAPVADVLTNPDDKIIRERSFGDNPQLVASFAGAVSDGLHDFGVMSTFKHFPGHGAVAEDTHEGFAYTEKSLDELRQVELIPFEQAEKFRIDAVMVAHISLPGVIGDDTPASLSEKMITEVLRQDLQYEGLVVTDALNMGAVSQKYTSAEAAVAAVNAGADLLLMPVDFHEAADGILQAVADGDITNERIDEAVMRIVYAKLKQNQYTKEQDADKDRIREISDNRSDNPASCFSMIDVSAYQGNINWTEVAASGIEGAMIRLGFRGYGAEGSLNSDDYYPQNIEGAKAVGLKVGVYFHSEAGNITEAEEEAYYVLKQLQNEKLELPVAFDLEYSNKTDKRSNFLNTGERTDIAIAFCRVIQSAGYEAMVYYDVAAPPDKTMDVSQLNGIHVWVADYQKKDKPELSGTYKMWQYSNTGSVKGISGNVDLDYFYP